MTEDDYLSEFYIVLEAKVRDWIASLACHTEIGPVDLTSPFESYINYRHYPLRNEYCKLRLAGCSKDDAITRIADLPIPAPEDKQHYNDSAPIPDSIRQWAEILKPFKGLPVYYANIPRMAKYLFPFIKKGKSNVLLVSDNDLTECGNDIPDNAILLKFPDAMTRLCRNDFMERHFPMFFSYVNTLLCLDRCIEPEVFYCVCGCHTQSKIWAAICNARGGKSVLYQHGWHAHMHAGFARLPFQEMILWGSRFKQLWEDRNPGIKYSVGGYPYPVSEIGKHDCVTFFLQEPYFVASEAILERFYNLIAKTAENNTGLTIQYRLHPESRINSGTMQRLDSLQNVKNVSDDPLEDVYASTKVAVSHYSSTIMECIVHKCCPLVFNPTPHWEYTPDIESEDIGFISTSEESFHKKLPLALSYRIPEHKIKEWYAPFSTLPAA